MALERRGNSHYFYEKERIGGKVRSVYSGKGEIAYLLNQMRMLKKDEETAKTESEQRDNDRLKETELERILESLADVSKVLTDALFLTNGFHQHKRQWRKKRNGKTK